MEFRSIESVLMEVTGLDRRPVAVAFVDEPPAGVPRFRGVAPSGCTFWRLAERGAFYTVGEDHYNCPIGCHTHSIPLPPERAAELDSTLFLMSEIGYLQRSEVPDIPRLPQRPRVIVYAPLAETPVAPDAVIFAGRPGRLMLLQEAALRAGVKAQPAMLGRPTCMAIPAAMQSGIVISSACIGNRVYTDLGEDELYMSVPGSDIDRISAEVRTVADANRILAKYYREKREKVAAQAAARG
jgi:uncharacterized protein (DUF169 family)